MTDPRDNAVKKRLSGVKRVIAVAAGKGGVGKTSVSSLLALALAEKGYKVGLFDLDFYGPSVHLVLGVESEKPEEDKGIIPPEVGGIKFMSIVFYSLNRPFAVRGKEITNAMKELLAITRWGNLDFLILDMPPGLGEATLDMIKFVKNIEFLVVSTPSKLSLETVKKLVEMLKESKAKLVGLIENMSDGDFKRKGRMFGLPVLGRVGFDRDFEGSLGSMEKLLKTSFLKDIRRIIPKIEGMKV